MPLGFTLGELLPCLLIGLVGGALGGLLGIGGGIVFIPALALVFGDERQHLHQAAVMIVNLSVSLAAVIRHRRAGAIRGDVLPWLVGGALVFIGVGVWAGDRLDGDVLARLFACFLLYVIIANLRRIRGEFRRAKQRRAEPVETRRPEEEPSPDRVSTARTAGIGGFMGFMAGLLGIGGGGIAVPLQQVVLGLPLRQCVGTSTAAIALTAGVGAIIKNATLHTHGFALRESLAVAAVLIPGAMIGGFGGAFLTHILPVRWIRLIFVGFLLVAGWRMGIA